MLHLQDGLHVALGFQWPPDWRQTNDDHGTYMIAIALLILTEQRAQMPAELLRPYIQSGMISPDETKFLSTGDGGPAMWDLRSGRMLYRFRSITARNVAAAFSHDGKYVALSVPHWGAVVWKSVSGQLVCKLHGQVDSVYPIAFSPGDTKVITFDYGEPSFWDVRSGRLDKVRAGLVFGFDMASVSRDGKVWAFDCSDGIVRVRNTLTGAVIQNLKSGSSYMGPLCISWNDARLITTSGEDATLWDIKTGRTLRRFIYPEALVQSASFSSDGMRIAIGDVHGTTTVWDIATGKRQLTLRGHTSRVNNVWFFAHDTRILTASKDGTARVWNAKNGALIRVI